MLYKSSLKQLPTIMQFYTVRRNTTWHITDQYNILIIITDGKCKFTSLGETVVAEKGDTYFIPAGTAYTREAINNEMCTMTYIHFTNSTSFENYSTQNFYNYMHESIKLINDKMFTDDIIENFDIFINTRTSIKHFKEVINLVDKINLFSTKRTICCSFQSALALANILLILYKTLLDSSDVEYLLKDTIEISPKIKKAINYISQNYTTTITLDELSHLCNVSKQQVIRYFKAYFNMTPMQYILNLKIAKAKELLYNQQTLNIKEVSNELGFDDQHYFSRLFKKQTGETPSEYKYRLHQRV